MMKQPVVTIFLAALMTVSLWGQATPPRRPRALDDLPRVDHHQHLASPEMVTFLGYEKQGITSIMAADVIKLLDAAGIQHGVLLSMGYAYGRPGREPRDEYERVKAENDWVAAQAALYPKRLIAFCGLNPLKDYAVAEIERCSKDARMIRGIKLHLGNSDVRLELPDHLAKLRAVFRAANAHKMAIVVHARASISLDRPYGAEQARLMLEELLPLVTNSVVQIAHLAGSGPGYNDPKAGAALQVYIDAIKRRDPRVKNLWFDLTSTAYPQNTPEMSALLAERIRAIGPDRVLYGTDITIGANLSPKDSWSQVGLLDLTDKEIKRIARNKAPYFD